MKIAEIDILPTWVIRTERGSAYRYQIIPLDASLSVGTNYGLTEDQAKLARASYQRTMNVVGSGLNAIRKNLGLTERELTLN